MLSSLGVAPGSVRVATKWWPLGRTYRSIGATIGRRIECLSPYPIDLYQIHQPYGLSSVKNEIGALGDLVEAGKVRAVGVSNFSAADMEKAQASSPSAASSSPRTKCGSACSTGR